MKTWEFRPREEAHLLNPALCCTLLAASAAGHRSKVDAGLSFGLSFLVLPIVLHKATRESLPVSVRTSMPIWIREHPQVRLLFRERVMSLRNFTREAMLFGTTHGWLTMENAIMSATHTEAVIDRRVQTLDAEIGDFVRRARFVGRWFANAGSAPTIMALWGVRP